MSSKRKPDTVGEMADRALYEMECEARVKNHPHIQITPGVCGGEPCIKGTRLTVSYVLDRLAVHGSIAKVVEVFAPNNLTSEQVKAALSFASDDVGRIKPAGGGEEG